MRQMTAECSELRDQLRFAEVAWTAGAAEIVGTAGLQRLDGLLGLEKMQRLWDCSIRFNRSVRAFTCASSWSVNILDCAVSIDCILELS